MAFVVGLVGEKGSGKGTLARLLEEAAPSGVRVAQVRFSDVLRETLSLWHLEHSRANLQALARSMAETFSAHAISDAVQHRIANAADLVIVDGVRWLADEQLIRSFPQNTMVYITVPPEVRYRRLRERNENIGETDASYEQFLVEEQARSERDIADIGSRADMSIVNDRSIVELQQAATGILRHALKLEIA
ncbi:MAG: AAA family ATPase [Candidatus Uhrbacteria bacterium]